MSEALPRYAAAEVKAALLDHGVSGTIYALVMPESEAALNALVDEDRAAFLEQYREAWTQKQDAMHEAYFERWIQWSAPVLDWDAGRFPFRYPTAGASEGIVKLMAEYAAREAAAARRGAVHMFEGEYEGFPAFAHSLGLDVVRHPREAWKAVAAERVPAHAAFWISQPSAIDGMVWPHFEAFAAALHAAQPEARLVPDLTYVGSVARAYAIALHAPNIHEFVISQSKPFGGYYHRAGAAFSEAECPSLFGNHWFKNLASIGWARLMMERHGVHDLPRRYAAVQAEAARRCGKALGVELAPCDVNLLASAPWRDGLSPLLASVGRGSEAEKVVRLCLTPTMARLIDPALAPSVPDLEE
ncbi:hypothetical protein [Sphingomicrobium arenosum]|uniref:hypothetical protein n=1 Tax=Sphingomicrobium arenosum TaxID=2233861 RepID=UPI002240FF7A|nr:hypothetical protein [Sphingomicrobium arenosum]